MRYQVGTPGRIVLARFEDGEDIFKNLTHIVTRERIESCVFYLLGGITDAKIVVGPADDNAFPPEPVWREMAESHEMLAIGTVFWYENEPRVHVHGAWGKFDAVRAGCLREHGKTYIVVEAVIIEIKGVNAVRDLDEATRMVLLSLKDTSETL